MVFEKVFIDVYTNEKDALLNLMVKNGMPKHDADDALHNIVVSIWERYKEDELPKRLKLPEPLNVLLYLYRAAWNAVGQYYRDSGKPFKYLDADPGFQIPDERSNSNPEEAVINRECVDEIEKALEGLTDLERKVIQLRYWDSLSRAQISEALSISYARVRYLELKAILKLKRCKKLFELLKFKQ